MDLDENKIEEEKIINELENKVKQYLSKEAILRLGNIKIADKEKEETKEKKKALKMPFPNVFKGFKQTLQPFVYIKDMFRSIFKKGPKEDIYFLLRKKSLEDAEQKSYTIYDIYIKNPTVW